MREKTRKKKKGSDSKVAFTQEDKLERSPQENEERKKERRREGNKEPERKHNTRQEERKEFKSFRMPTNTLEEIRKEICNNTKENEG